MDSALLHMHRRCSHLKMHVAKSNQHHSCLHDNHPIISPAHPYLCGLGHPIGRVLVGTIIVDVSHEERVDESGLAQSCLTCSTHIHTHL